VSLGRLRFLGRQLQTIWGHCGHPVWVGTSREVTVAVGGLKNDWFVGPREVLEAVGASGFER